ncbi:TetR/AcrR family transcriptional regulator [Paenibacillus radicis (ex Xue et al. 2023)]|uniref:TetR/AcrR family transcriptional regulator n=1 Tax=Paenibacillus radicis (ex Xue et al. 2023) TaxID=2972489 RepID=A0ABT1YND7_9BACL|nr:TetR/AcrR family transcriptional regulator [Paenibacillus radicis (ex Xue et al. 2023)]MCR8634690.1 TetR/AcrR family transcriptional regulator [Paenibacillus radicis (ex Xue et al. 2023)]
MGEDKKEGIIEAALKLFEEQGYHTTKVSDIVRVAGVAQGTFYLYFKSKEDLFRSIAESCLDEIAVTIKQNCTGNVKDEAFYRMMQDTLRVYYHNKSILKILKQHGSASSEIGDISDAFYRRIMLVIKQSLMEWGAFPNYSEQQLEVMAFSKIGMVEMVAYQYFIIQKYDETHIESLAQILTGINAPCELGPMDAGGE